MRILVIGGTGHIGCSLIPRLTAAGHDVTVVARKAAPRYADPRLGWQRVRWVLADRAAEEKTGRWTERLAALETDAVVDTICFTREQAETLVRAFRGRIRQLVHIGSIWAYGPPDRLPYAESDPRRPITSYGRRKAEIEAYLLDAFRTEGFPATVLHPGHICGRGWLPIDPQGSRDGTEVYHRLARGEPVVLPDRGQTTLHHVHADDIAQLCELALERRSQALGESFSAVAPHALALAGCCRAVAAWFGTEPNLVFVPLAELDRHVGAASAAIIREHAEHSPCCSIAKGRRLLGYQPLHTPERIYAETIEALLASGELKLD